MPDLNWLDITLGLILLVSLIGAMLNGVTREIVRILALVLGIAGAMWGYERLAPHLAPYIDDPQIAQFAAFALIVIGCLLAGSLVAWALVKLWGATGLRWFDRLLGAGFGLVRGLVIATALVLGVVAFSPVAGAEKTVAESRLAPWVLHGARLCAMAAPPSLRGAFDSGFERVRSVWSNPEIPAVDDLLKDSPI